MPKPRPGIIQKQSHDQDRRDKLHHAQPFLGLALGFCIQTNTH
jgi:hypothetical protein